MRSMDYLTHLDRESRRFAALLADTDPAAPVPTCPDWTAADLLWHLTEVQWFWGTIATERMPDPAPAEASKPERPREHPELLALFDAAHHHLATALAEGDDDTPAWTWASNRTIGFIRRRQAHEALIHRVDAELTAGRTSALDNALAADGVDEVLRVMWAELPEWATFTPDAATARFETADTGDRWLVRLGRVTGTDPDDGQRYDEDCIEIVDTDAGPAAVIRAAAADLDRWLWGRAPADALAMSGDQTVLGRLQGIVAGGIQ